MNQVAKWMSEQGMTKFSDLEKKIDKAPPWKSKGTGLVGINHD